MASRKSPMLVLCVTTLAFMVCFVVWMMFGVIGIQLRTDLNLNGTEFGLLTATPVLTGALLRLPLGIWTDRFGGRLVMTVLLVLCAIPVFLISFATAFWQFVAIGLFLGAVGASFAVGTPYVARFFPPEKRGFAMGFFRSDFCCDGVLAVCCDRTVSRRCRRIVCGGHALCRPLLPT